MTRGCRESPVRSPVAADRPGEPEPTLTPGVVELPEEKSAPARDAIWNVVVFNDPINLMTYVTMVFQRVFGYSREKASRHMLEVHRRGRSIVWSGNRERAETYTHQLHGYQLLAQIERVDP